MISKTSSFKMTTILMTWKAQVNVETLNSTLIKLKIQMTMTIKWNKRVTIILILQKSIKKLALLMMPTCLEIFI